MKKGILGATVLGIMMAVGIILALSCMKRIPAGYAGVVYNFSTGVSGDVLNQGWHFVPPTKKVTIYSVGIEQSYLTSEDKGDSHQDESFSTPTADGKSLKVDLEFSYMFDRDKISETFIKFKGQDGKTVKDIFIKPKMKAWTQEVTAKYPVTDVFGDKRQELNEELDIYLKEKFKPYGIVIDTVNFTNIDTDSETKAAIQKKVTAQQEKELAQIEANTAKINAEKDKEVAEIQAEQEIIKAKGKADSKKIAAAAEAEANKKIAESLTPELIEKIKYEQWNGKLPKVQGNGSTIVDITK